MIRTWMGGRTAASRAARIVGLAIVGVLLFPVVLVFLFGLLLFADELDKTERTTGTVTSLAPVDELSGMSGCDMLVQFEVDGRVFTTDLHGTSGSTCDALIGTTVPVIYDPDHPAENTAGDSDNKTTGLVIMAVTGAMCLIGVGVVGGIVKATRSSRVKHLGQVLMGDAQLSNPRMQAWLDDALAESESRGVAFPRADASPVAPPVAPSVTPPVAPPAAPPVAPPVRPRVATGPVWDPRDDKSPASPGWYPVGNGTTEQWFNGLTWSESTRPYGSE